MPKSPSKNRKKQEEFDPLFKKNASTNSYISIPKSLLEIIDHFSEEKEIPRYVYIHHAAQVLSLEDLDPLIFTLRQHINSKTLTRKQLIQLSILYSLLGDLSRAIGGFD